MHQQRLIPGSQKINVKEIFLISSTQDLRWSVSLKKHDDYFSGRFDKDSHVHQIKLDENGSTEFAPAINTTDGKQR
jgi:hypothetical protein